MDPARMPRRLTDATIELVVAVAENDAIGRGNALPWHLPADLRHFKEITLGHSVLMGRKTFESIGRALPGRRNLVLTRSPGFAAADCIAVASVDEALDITDAGLPLMVIGGAEVFQVCLGHAARIHLTIVHAQIADADAYFQGWRGLEWREARRERHEADERNAFAYSFVTLERG